MKNMFMPAIADNIVKIFHLTKGVDNKDVTKCVDALCNAYYFDEPAMVIKKYMTILCDQVNFNHSVFSKATYDELVDIFAICSTTFELMEYN